MKKNHILFYIVAMMCVSYGYTQIPYLDQGALVREFLEEPAAKDFQKQNLKTTIDYTSLSALAVTENLTRTNFRFNSATSAFINYLDYSSMCNSYLNPFKKAKCTNKYNYLKNAHQTILQLVNVPMKNRANKGVKEQIMAKYSAITNTILKELELLKLKAEKDNFYTRLIIR
ncbi:hypothetical protein [Aquimarina pacifica]|uniref:hypothetical protein n=1 Tax=Aquimarina pacifica TaxID=1296415 RepID=UPI00046F70D5|nr:hypothetical protein [Aquimarina pacifica]